MNHLTAIACICGGAGLPAGIVIVKGDVSLVNVQLFVKDI